MDEEDVRHVMNFSMNDNKFAAAFACAFSQGSGDVFIEVRFDELGHHFFDAFIDGLLDLM
jgi:hypothetical protein